MNSLPEGRRLDLLVLEERLAVCRLDADDEIPGWALRCGFFSIVRTRDELSIVCLEEVVPRGVKAERGRRALRVTEAMDFSIVGVLASLVVPLAEAGISLFSISTFNTDYILVHENDLDQTLLALRNVGHIVASANFDDP